MPCIYGLPTDRHQRYDAVVFSGGGCRCFWQVGFWEVAAPALGWTPRIVGAVSAGSAMACMLFGDAVADTLAYFKARVAANRRNVYPWRALRRQPIFPHPEIYRNTILANLDAARLARLQSGPDVRVLVALVPRWLGPRSGSFVGFAAYQLEWLRLAGPHSALGRQAGFEPSIGSVRACRTVDELAELILCSSCTPPITPIYRRGGRPVLDGGLIDSAPLETIPAPVPPTLVLLTRPYAPRAIPHAPGRTYVLPSEPVPVHKWDCTSASRVQATYDLGHRDGERFLRAWRHRAADRVNPIESP